MSVTQVPLRPLERGSLLKLWLAIALLVVAAFALAKLGTQPFRSQTTTSGIEFRSHATAIRVAASVVPSTI